MWYKSLAFWSAVSWVLAGVLGLLVYFGVLPVEYGYSAALILTAVQAVFKFLGVDLELRSRGLK